MAHIKGLDRYLTQEPPDNSAWFESCSQLIQCTDEEYEKYESKIDYWMDYFFVRDYTYREAASCISNLIKRYESQERNSFISE